MKKYNKYLVSLTDQFNAENFSPVMEEVSIIKEKTDKLPAVFKAEILISFLKEHTLQDNWILENPELTGLVTSGELFQGSIESLFESARNNPGFRQDLENYLMERFDSPVTPMVY